MQFPLSIFFFVQACGGVLEHKISWGESDLCNQSEWRVLVEDIELREESGSGFVLTWAFSKSKNMPLFILIRQILSKGAVGG